MIKIKCYGKTEVWNDRDKAIRFYFAGAMGSDGSEASRYSFIVFSLMNGADYVDADEC